MLRSDDFAQEVAQVMFPGHAPGAMKTFDDRGCGADALFRGDFPRDQRQQDRIDQEVAELRPGRLCAAPERLAAVLTDQRREFRGAEKLRLKLSRERRKTHQRIHLRKLEFGGDEFFEDIIFSINRELRDGEDIASLERDLARILDQEASPREELKIRKKINPGFKRFIRAVSVKDLSLKSEEAIVKMVGKMASLERISKKAALCKFRDTYFIFLSQDTDEIFRFRALLADIFAALSIDESKIHCGVSAVLPISEDFGKVVREAFWACNVAVMENDPARYYDNIGIYRLIIPEIHSKNILNYMREYLSPLGDVTPVQGISGRAGREEGLLPVPVQGEKNVLLETACVYILSKGDLDETAAKLFCHKNTVRYRLSKLHEILDPYSNDKEFHENLSIAVRIYMLSQFL